ncbi:MAG: hypothetical protein U0996_17260 [Planctomycetaceae bacterium]
MFRMPGWFLVVVPLLVNVSPVLGQKSQPLLVIVEADLTFRAEQRLTAISQFECTDQLHSVQLNGLTVKPSYTIRNKDGFSGKTGIIYCLTGAQQLAKCRFWTVSGPDVFHDFLGTLMEARGEGASMDGSEFQKVIRVAPQPAVPGQPTYTWQDVYVSYFDGIIFLGGSDAALHFEDSSVLSDVLAQAKGNDEYLWAGLKHVPEAIRQQFMTVLSGHLGVQMQRADAEGETEFRERHDAAVALQEVARSMLFDINELTAWMSYPTNDAPMKAGFRIQAKKDSAFDQLMRATRTSSSLSRPHADRALATMDVCCLIPGVFEPVARQAFERLTQSAGLPRLAEKAEGGLKLDLSLTFGAHAENPFLSAAAFCGDSHVDVENVRTVVNSQLALLSANRGSPVSDVVQRLSPVAARVDHDCLHLELGSTPATQTSQETPEDSARPFFRLVADLGKLRDLSDPKTHGNNFTPFLDLYRRAMIWKLLPEGMEQIVDQRDLAKRKGKPIVDHVLEGGDWSARAVGTTDGEMTVVTATVGRELYYFYLAETLVAEASLFRAFGMQ